MKIASKIALLLLALGATFAVAQIQPGMFKHIIIVVQENRTPDNLFGAAAGPYPSCGSEYDFQPGVDIDNGGYNNKTNQLLCNMSLPLDGFDADVANGHAIGYIDPDHSYDEKTGGWVADYDYHDGQGHMDGFCHEYGKPSWPHPCPSYSFVPKSDVMPYFQIAETYSFANYMFETGEGPSFPAHQILFTGTSAPVAPYDSNDYYQDFVAEIAGVDGYGCGYTGKTPPWVDPTGSEFTMDSYPECYTHDTLVTVAANCNGGTDSCDRGHSWGYYMPLDRAIW